MPLNKRDYREETALNHAEELALKELSGDLGLSKSATLRYCLHLVVNHVARKKRIADIGELTEV